LSSRLVVCDNIIPLVPSSVFGNIVIDTSGAFTLDIKSVLNENLGGILGGTKILNGRYLNVK
jgi:hypothetical protein